MPDTDELDRIWRDGLSSVAVTMTAVTDPMTRVTRRVRQKHRARTTRIATSGAILVALIVAVASFVRGTHADTRFSTAGPVTRVNVVAGPTLRIRFPNRAVSGQPPHVTLPHGRIRFSIRSAGGSHRLVIDGVEGFVADVDGSHTSSEVVSIRPGRYRMHCTILGHTSAGEEAILIVQ